MLGRRDRFSGNILLYDYLSRNRAPVLLHRNLKQSFRIHEHLVKYGNTDNYLGSNSNLRHKWEPPSWDLLDTMIAKEKAAGSFILEVHGIQRLGTGRSDHDNDPANKITILMRVKSTIRVSIIPSSSDIHTANPPGQEAILRGVDKDANEYASVELDPPILIKPEDLVGDLGRILHDDAYKMIISVNLASHHVAEELYQFMGLDTLNSSCYLSTQYANILECPHERTLLPLKAATKQLDIGLEVSMYWNDHTGGSVLENCNRHLKKTIQQPRSYPTPPLDVEPRYRLTFVYGTESLERSELVCLHCRRHNFSDIEDLRMHLLTWHDYFVYSVAKEGIDEHGIEHWRFESELADHKADSRQRASDRADETHDIRVLAPNLPFDRRRYLRGDDGFHRAARIEKPSKNAKMKAAVDGPIIAPIRRHRKPPDQVQARPVRNKKTYVVPRAPSGITFFRSFSKRPLRHGEAISESDDELDEGWMHLRKHTEIDKEGLLEAAALFIKIFDSFMHEETLHSDMHAGDAIIRFSQSQAARIFQEGLFDEFKKKLDELLEDNVITKEVHDGALEIVTAWKSNSTDSNELSQRLAELDVQQKGTALGPAGHKANKGPPPKKDRKGKGKAVVTDTGHLTPITADSDGDVDMRNTSLYEPPDPPDTQSPKVADPAFDLCYCGGDASATPGSSGIIACSNIDCIRRHFHLACLPKHGKSLPPPLKLRAWTCDDCKGNSGTAS